MLTVLCNGRFHVNDVDNEVIARNIILLEIISSINADDLGDIEYLWDIWYNMTVSEGHHTRLKVTLERLLDGSSSSQWKFGDSATKKHVAKTWKSWLETKPWDDEGVKKSRQDILELYCQLRSNRSTSEIMTVPSQQFCKDVGVLSQSMDEGSWSKYMDEWSKYMDEWNQVYKAGIARDFVSVNSCRNSGEVINPTMMRPGSRKWHVPGGSNPMEAYLPFKRYQHMLCRTQCLCLS